MSKSLFQLKCLVGDGQRFGVKSLKEPLPNEFRIQLDGIPIGLKMSLDIRNPGEMGKKKMLRPCCRKFPDARQRMFQVKLRWSGRDGGVVISGQSRAGRISGKEISLD